MVNAREMRCQKSIRQNNAVSERRADTPELSANPNETESSGHPDRTVWPNIRLITLRGAPAKLRLPAL